MEAFPATDRNKWKLNVDRGRQVWTYNENQSPNEQKCYDKYFLGLSTSENESNFSPTTDLKSAIRNAMSFYSSIQTEDGHWADDYGGPMFLLPGLVITCYITGTHLIPQVKQEIIYYLSVHVNSDGGWGLHIKSESTMFGTSLNYVILRLLGVGRDEPLAEKARSWIHKNGGAYRVPHWGKFWLATLGVLDWDGVNAVLPELWSLPYFLPFHPGRFWCHCRVVYLPMAYIYGKKYTAKIDSLIEDLRKELYVESYEEIKWSAHRFDVFDRDLYKNHSWIVKTIFPICNLYDRFQSWFPWIRNRALENILDHIRYEDEQTHYIDIGPVNKMMDMLSEYYASDGKSEAFKAHQERIMDYLWLARDGMKMQGYNGCQLWNTAFALQAYIEAGPELVKQFTPSIELGYKYVDITQISENSYNGTKYYRHISKGAWPFSTKDHSWPISDCTAEALRAAILVPKIVKSISTLSNDRIFDSVNVLLSYQNSDGGWPTYELKRAGGWLEYLNPAECFDGIMVDYSYIECTSAVIRTLCVFQEFFSDHRKSEINNAITRGLKFICDTQRSDGSWHGSWAVCYTYAIWFGVTALTTTQLFKVVYTPQINKACNFLRQKQAQNGSWSEDFESCVKRTWVNGRDNGHVVNTAWALLSLMAASRPQDQEAVKKGIIWLSKMQKANGDWDQPQICGVFNFNCAISYESYKNYFPIWAMGIYMNSYEFGSNLNFN